MSNKYKKIIFSLAAIFFILLPQVSLAQGIKDAFGSKSPLAEVKGRAGYSDEDIGSISGRVINTVLSLVGIIFLLLMVYAGYLWMTAQGEESKIDSAQNIIKGAVIGLVLVLSAYAITVFVTKGLNPSASSSSTRSAGCYDQATLLSICTSPKFVCSGLNQKACTASAVGLGNVGASSCCEWQP